MDFTSATTKRQRHLPSSSSCSNLAESGYVLFRPVQPNRFPVTPKSARLHVPPTTFAPPAKVPVVTPTNAASTSDASPTHVAQAASVSTSVDDEGFITVVNKKSRSRAAKSGNDLAPTPVPLPPLMDFNG